VVRYVSLFCALIFNLHPVWALPMVKRVIGGGDLVPGNAEIQDSRRESPVRQTVLTNNLVISGFELYATRYPKNESVDLILICEHEGTELRRIRQKIPPVHLFPIRITFEPIQGYDTLDFIMYPDHMDFGRGVRILFFPRDHYPGGELSIGGRRIEGDLLFQVLTPNPSTTTYVPGLDLFNTGTRFPSPTLPPGNRLVQEFAASRDSLSFIEFIAGTGGSNPGPNLRWSVEKPSDVVGHGIVPIRYDNETIRVTFPTIEASRGAPLKLVLEIAGSWDGDLRFWLCPRLPGMGGLSVADRRVDASLVLRTFHTTATRDSMAVCISAVRPPPPIPSGPVAGSCRLVQEFNWEETASHSDFIGMRLAVGGGLASGSVSYAVETIDSARIISSGSVSLAGYGSDDFVWFPVGFPHENGRMRLELSAPELRSENAARFWWSPFDIVPDTRAYGCIPSGEGDCAFKLAVGYSPREWLQVAPSLVGAASGNKHGGIVTWFAIGRGIILIIMVILAMTSMMSSLFRSDGWRKNE